MRPRRLVLSPAFAFTPEATLFLIACNLPLGTRRASTQFFVLALQKKHLPVPPFDLIEHPVTSPLRMFFFMKERLTTGAGQFLRQAEERALERHADEENKPRGGRRSMTWLRWVDEDGNSVP
jgi:hypothetical protein